MKPLFLIFLVGICSLAFAKSTAPSAADVQRDFLIAILNGDKTAAEKLALPNPEMAILFSDNETPVEIRKEAIAYISAHPYRVLKVGEVFRFPDGRTIGPTLEMEKKGWVIVANDTDPVAHMLFNSEGSWKVDSQGLIAARKAAAKARGK